MAVELAGRKVVILAEELARRKVVIGCGIGGKNGRYWLLNWLKGKSSLTDKLGEGRPSLAVELVGRRVIMAVDWWEGSVPDHNGGRPMEVNACILITHMVYL